MTLVRTEFYEIEADLDRKHICLRFQPTFWDMAVVEGLFRDVLTIVARMGDPTEIRTLADLRNATLQSATVIAAIQEALLHRTAGRVALVAASPLARMQTKRLQVRDGVRFFAVLEEAQAWLFDDADEQVLAAAG